MLDALPEAELLRGIPSRQFLGMVSAVAVVRIASEVVAFAAKVGVRVHWTMLKTIAKGRSEDRWIDSIMCGMFWIFYCRSTIAFVAGLA